MTAGNLAVGGANEVSALVRRPAQSLPLEVPRRICQPVLPLILFVPAVGFGNQLRHA